MRETGPVGCRLSKASDARYLGFARKYLGAMMNIHQGLQYGRFSTRLLDGTKVSIQWIGDHKLINISTEFNEFEEEEFDNEVFMESGFCNVTTGTDFAANVYYPSELQGDLAALVGGEDLSWLDWLYVDQLTSQSRPYVAGMASIALFDNTIALRALSVATHSGKAVLFVQALMGTRDFARAKYEGDTVPE